MFLYVIVCVYCIVWTLLWYVRICWLVLQWQLRKSYSFEYKAYENIFLWNIKIYIIGIQAYNGDEVLISSLLLFSLGNVLFSVGFWIHFRDFLLGFWSTWILVCELLYLKMLYFCYYQSWVDGWEPGVTDRIFLFISIWFLEACESEEWLSM